MICLKKAKRFCKDYTQIENYEEAINDKTHMWDCHHILGEVLSCEQLKDHDFYYDVPPCMLKFVTRSEHQSIHKSGDKNGFYGKKHSDDARSRMSASHKGHNVSDETRRKISEANKGRKHSEESRKKMSDAAKRSWASKRLKKNTLQDTV